MTGPGLYPVHVNERDVCDAWRVKWHRSRRVRKRRLRRATQASKRALGAWFGRAAKGWHGYWTAQGRLRVMLAEGWAK